MDRVSSQGQTTLYIHHVQHHLYNLRPHPDPLLPGARKARRRTPHRRAPTPRGEVQGFDRAPELAHDDGDESGFRLRLGVERDLGE